MLYNYKNKFKQIRENTFVCQMCQKCWRICFCTILKQLRIVFKDVLCYYK